MRECNTRANVCVPARKRAGTHASNSFVPGNDDFFWPQLEAHQAAPCVLVKVRVLALAWNAAQTCVRERGNRMPISAPPATHALLPCVNIGEYART